MNKITLGGAALLFASSSYQVLAHSEHDKARFVANSGIDKGNCSNVVRPCQSIAYAVSQANKGDKILVASGKYEITSSDELFFLKSQLVPVLGGYNRFDHFQSQSPNSNTTTLTNIPTDMAENLRKKGFNVLADGKSLNDEQSLKTKLSAYHMLSQQQNDLVCEGGKAGAFDCNNIDLLAHVPLKQMSSSPSSGNDIWGHVDLNNNNEYALIGVNNGIAVFNITDPVNPVEVGTIDGRSSSWRDIKVYQYFDHTLNKWNAYAYATIDSTIDYVSIIDLNNLPHSVSLAEQNKVVSKAHNVYISNVDYSLNTALYGQTPSLQLIGSNRRGGAFESYSLADPKTLARLASVNYGDGYTHDGSSMLIEDNRAQQDCGSSNNQCTVFIDFNETEMKLWDISNPEATSHLGTASYNDVSTSQQYVHSGWGTEDQQFIFLHDEFDEQKAGLNSTVRIFSITDLNNPTQVGQWTGPTRAIDHNGYVRGNRYYMSNYERGLTVLDISDPANPVDVGFFDTYTPSNSASFNGAWGVYPFLPSGNIIVSDINSGLYVLKDNTKANPQGELAFTHKTITSEQDTQLSITVSRTNVSQASPVSVDYEVLSGSATIGTDVTFNKGTLNWAQDDKSDKTIILEIAADSGNEVKESFFVRLTNPTNGANIGNTSYLTVELSGIADSGSVAFNQREVKVPENQGSIDIALTRGGSTDGLVSYQYQVVSGQATVGEDVAALSGELTWQDGEDGEKTITVALINDSDSEEDESFTIELSSINDSLVGDNNVISITIADDENNQAPTITLNENFEANTSQSVTLTAEVIDNEEDPVTYSWQQTGGSNVSISNSDALQANFVAPTTASTLTFEFTATDFRGASSTQEITVTIVAAPVVTPPVTPPANNSSGGGSFAYLSLLALGLLSIRKFNK